MLLVECASSLEAGHAVRVKGLSERLGASLRRAPYVWLVASVLLLFVMTSPLRVIVTPPDKASTPIAVGGTFLILYGVLVYLGISSRRMAPALARTQSANQTAFFKWILAEAPFLVGYAAVAAGGQPWVWAVGFITSTVLFVHTARHLARAARVA